MKNITVVGDGGWGTALALLLLKNGHSVRLWGPFKEQIDGIRISRENSVYLPGIPLPEGLILTADEEEAVKGIDLLVAAVPSRYFRSVLEHFKGMDHPVLTVSKGLDPGTMSRMSVVVTETLGDVPVCALSGPSHAEEVARGRPTAVVAASTNHDLAQEIQDMFMNDTFRVYSATDITGVELGGALKNVIALAAGVADGLGLGDNTKAALITRGLAEITRLGCACGAEQSTFAGLSGMGDLIVTCTSRHSRNRSFGERLGKGETMDDILGSMKQVAEGVSNCPIVLKLAKAMSVEVPIAEQVNAVLTGKTTPQAAITTLMTRDARPERD